MCLLRPCLCAEVSQGVCGLPRNLPGHHSGDGSARGGGARHIYPAGRGAARRRLGPRPCHPRRRRSTPRTAHRCVHPFYILINTLLIHPFAVACLCHVAAGPFRPSYLNPFVKPVPLSAIDSMLDSGAPQWLGRAGVHCLMQWKILLDRV